MANGLVVFDPNGEKHRASPVEQAQFDADVKARKHDELMQMLAALDDHKLDKKMYKGFRAKGLQQSKTRSVYAWRMRERRNTAEKFESFSARTDKYGNQIPPQADMRDWDYAPPGEGTLFRLMPRTRIADLEVFDVWVVRVAKGRKRKRCLRKDFKRNCGEGKCGKSTCAMCWAIEKAQVRDDETIVVMRRDGPHPRVVDSSGVHPKGARSSKAQDLGEDQKGPFQLTSSLYSHKKGASAHGRGDTLDRDPADGRKYHR